MGILRRLGHAVERRRRLRASTFFCVAVTVVGATLLAAASATAGPAVSETTPISFTADNLCTGEAIAGNGSLHAEVNENLSASGTLQSHMMWRLDGLSATGVLSGKRYVVQQTENHEFVFASSGTSEETFNETVHFIRLGEDGTLILGDDFYETFKTHITANAAGVHSFRIDTSDEPCR